MAAARMSPMLRLAWRVHRWLFRISSGRIGKRSNGFRVLLLTTRGRRSGAERRAALQYLPHRDGWAVVASHVGEDRDPAWWLNLQANPDAEVLVDGLRRPVRGRAATDDERMALFGKFAEVDAAYTDYAERTSRVIPVVVLECR
jgi:deazaflavin-dependent oxidoreductase (nitroreductase family)